ncbi:DUF3000 family protein [Bifidobacterium vansinderenii]|uniref:Permease n=1 Tax=Bifidobacterium vansinderenii TaxID=1984871 RepID=A0A229VW02_9BIFI|nr:DUF3000 family protein [Bifidobacterium vansinderenii]OXM99589.1 hypothetical protein Tam10B_2337 [Bifidobacterium vansinderenii]
MPTVPQSVWRAVESVRVMKQRPDIHYCEIPVPSTLADYGIGVQLELDTESAVFSRGWIMILYSERRRIEWESQWRCVAYASMRMAGSDHNSLTPSLMWDWLERIVTEAREETLGGTVSLNRNTSFGILSGSAEEPPRSDCEIRVSWTPIEEEGGWLDAGNQVDIWARFLKSMTTNDELEEPISDRE